MSTDAERLDFAAKFGPYVVMAPIEVLVVLWLVWREVGAGAFVGFGVLVFFFLPLQMALSRRFGRLRSRAARITDRRVRLMSEIIAGCVPKSDNTSHSKQSAALNF